MSRTATTKSIMTELDQNFAPKGNDSLVYTGDIRRGLEGTHVYKINGYYYLYSTYGGLDGFQAALRSKNIYGPYEQMVVIRDTTHGVNYGIHQGALVKTQTGEWWTMLFVDNGPLGRFPSLQPVTWKDGWPMVGVNGKAVVTYRKPNVGGTHPITVLPTSDEFDKPELGMQWEWNHNPDPTKWSLTEEPGCLRLKTATVVDSLPKARNTLTQRIFAYYSDSLFSLGTTKMDFGHMKDGDIAGLAVFQDPYAFIAIKRMNGKNFIIMVNDGKTVDSAAVEGSTIYLRASALHGSGAAPYYGGKTVPGSGKASFSYSLDNRSFVKIGNALQMKFNLRIFTGNKFCLFNYATLSTGGYVDFDWFRTSAPTEPRIGAQDIGVWSGQSLVAAPWRVPACGCSAEIPITRGEIMKRINWSTDLVDSHSLRCNLSALCSTHRVRVGQDHGGRWEAGTHDLPDSLRDLL